jgi:hypothetical protein
MVRTFLHLLVVVLGLLVFKNHLQATAAALPPLPQLSFLSIPISRQNYSAVSQAEYIHGSVVSLSLSVLQRPSDSTNFCSFNSNTLIWQ